MLLTSDNEFSLGIAKSLLREEKIFFEYDSQGYRISYSDFLKVSERLSTILNLEVLKIK